MNGLTPPMVNTNAGPDLIGDNQVVISAAKENPGILGADQKISPEAFAFLLEKLSKNTASENVVMGEDKKIKSDKMVETETKTETETEIGELVKKLLGANQNMTEVPQSEDEKSLKKSLVKSLIKENKPSAENKNNSETAMVNGLVLSSGNSTPPEIKLDQKITKAENNIDQLLNRLKGTTNEPNDSETENVVGKKINRDEIPSKNEIKTESPLDFLINNSKKNNDNEVTELIPFPKNQDNFFAPKKMMTGDEFIKNLNLSNTQIAQLEAKNNNNLKNIKEYSNGSTLLTDPLIKNTKDLAFKTSIHKTDEEIKIPETKIKAELALIKQDIIPEMVNNNKSTKNLEDKNQVSSKIFDLNKIDTSNTNEIIKKITDYVEQNQVANKSSLDLTVRHETLGDFKVQVSKMPTQIFNKDLNQIDMQITTSSKEGHDFFLKNEASLVKNLGQAGINLSDFRIVSSTRESNLFGQTDSRQSSSFKHNLDGSGKEFNSFESSNFSGDTSRGTDRRKQLWEEYQQRYGA